MVRVGVRDRDRVRDRGRLGVEHPAYLGEDRHGLCEVVDAHLGG